MCLINFSVVVSEVEPDLVLDAVSLYESITLISDIGPTSDIPDAGESVVLRGNPF